jgi:GntR family transcriptional regulator
VTGTRHQAISRRLRERIQDGTYPPGSKLPSLPALMQEFDAARDTVRDAVARLANEGLVTPLRGIGTVVRNRTTISMAYDPAKPAQLWSAQTSESPSSDRVVQTGWETADSDIAAWLHLPDGSRVLHRVRYQSKGDQVAQIHDQWVPTQLAEQIRVTTGDDLGNISQIPSTDLFSQMRAAGITPTTVTETITARMPHPDETDTLELPPGVPVIRCWRITKDAANVPIETSILVAAADRTSWSYTVPI